MASLYQHPRVAPTASGNNYASSKLYFYAAGTTTPIAVYANPGLTVSLSNPVVASADGVFPAIFINESTSSSYRVIHKSAGNVSISDTDNIPAGVSAAQIGAALYPRTSAEISASVVPSNFQYAPGDVRRYGAVGDGVTNDTVAVNRALSSGAGEVLFPPGTYMVDNLSQTLTGQVLRGEGFPRLQKRANGPIITIAGNDVRVDGISFAGDAVSPIYSGDNIVATGERPKFINCDSRWASGRALKATGNGVLIVGTAGIWQTADSTATGYDIEIGVSGTATLYHQLFGVYSSQSTGGIKFIDCGSQSVIGGQFGKYTVAAGTTPVGSNGGMVSGARILGAVSIGLSSAIIMGCQISTVSVTFLAGTAGCVCTNNVFASGATVTNSGNVNNLIVREVSAGSTNNTKIGPDSSTAVLISDPASGKFTFPGVVQVPNNTGALQMLDSAGTNYATVNMSASNNLTIANNNGAVQIAASGSNVLQLIQGGTEKWAVDANGRLRGGGSGGPQIVVCTGTPEAAITAPVGSIALRTDGGASTTLYVKQSGTGNTGWVAK